MPGGKKVNKQDLTDKFREDASKSRATKHAMDVEELREQVSEACLFIFAMLSLEILKLQSLHNDKGKRFPSRFSYISKSLIASK